MIGRNFFLLILLAGLWWLIAALLNNPVFPAPWTAFMYFFYSIHGDLLIHLGVSFYRVVSSLFISFLLAVPLGLFIGREKKIDEFISPAIYLLYPIPKVALLPVFLVIFGIGDFSKIALIVLIVFFQMLVTARDASRNINPNLVLSMLSLGASRKHVYSHVIWPASLPKVLTAIRIALGTSLAVLFFTETYGTHYGIGYFIVDSWARMNYGEMFAGIIGISLLGLLLFIVLDIVEKKCCPWNISST